MRKLIYLLSLMLLGFTAQAQQDAQFTQYMFNPVYWNPATSGNEVEYIELNVIHRSQWLGYSGTFDDGTAPTTQSFTLSMPFPRVEGKEGGNHWGLGVSFVHDETGLFRNVEAQLGISYHHELKSGKLSFGVSSGIYNQSLDGSRLRFVTPGDPLDPGDETVSDLKADLSAGIYFNSARYFAGIAASGLLGSEFAFNPTNDSIASALAIHMNFMGGYNFDVSTNWRLTPTTIVKFAEADNLSYEVSLLLTNHDDDFDKFYFGFAYRDSEGPSGLVGAYLGKRKHIRIGYAFDLVLQGQNAKERTSHEVMLTYRMPPMVIRRPGQIHTPRFKHL